jgi:hypothetical protein
MIFLGMRTPNLANKNGPIPRPRAIVEISSKSSYQIDQNQDQTAVSTCQAVSLAVPVAVPSLRASTPGQKFLQYAGSYFVARAPPLVLFPVTT